MNYDHKRRLLWSEKADNMGDFSGTFRLTVTDNTGNTKTYSVNL